MILQKSGLSLIIKLLFTAILLSNLSCAGIKPGSKSKAGKYFETFYIGDGKNQYFIKPIEFEEENHSAKIDFTIRDFEYKEKGGTANFSVFSNSIISKIDSVQINTESDTITIINLQRMFFEKYKSGYQIRNSFVISNSAIDVFFSSEKLQFIVFSDNLKISFPSDKSNSKIRNQIFSDLIELLKYY